MYKFIIYIKNILYVLYILFMTDTKRTFKIKSVDGTFKSRLIGSTPKQAAMKALSIIHNSFHNNTKDNNKIEVIKGGGDQNTRFKFTIRETTRLSSHKEYTYTGYREKLKTPAEYTIKSSNGDTKTIVNKYKNVVEKFKE
jgi:hypothetical protein